MLSFQGWKAAAHVPGRALPLPVEIPFGKPRGAQVQTGASPDDKGERERVWGCAASLQPLPASLSRSRALELEQKALMKVGGWVLPVSLKTPLLTPRLGD